ncbi:MAG: VanZ family protein [Chitinispirillaceae bacterium]|nr:VanZ family protein [Chitinispirillaceae bacterium]
MIRFEKKNAHLIAACAVVLLITLFFGLKPKGFRFINQVKRFENKNGIAFTNIGMAYSKGTLGEIGISDSVCIVMEVRPYRTGRRRSSIVSIVDDYGRELFTVDQWMKGIEITLWDGNGNRVRRAGIGEALSADSFRSVIAGINDREMRVVSGAHGGSKELREIRPPPGFLKKGRIVLGLSPTGRCPWRGEIAGLALFGRGANETEIDAFVKAWEKAGSFESLSHEKPAALFRFDGHAGRTIVDQSGNGWDLTVPRFPKMFRYEVLELLPDSGKIDRSLIVDILVNFFGFLPLGGCCCFLLLSFGSSRRQAYLLTVAAALCISLGIELWQVFIPTRASQLIDVILNSAGALVGAVGAGLCIKG